jgi:hypothetical protein
MAAKFLTICLTVMMCAGITRGQTSFEKDSIAIVNMERKFLEAEFRLDTSTISGMMHPAFLAIGPGDVSGKQEELKGIYLNIERRLKEKHLVDSFYFDDVYVKIFDNCAVCTFVVVSRGTINGTAFSNRRTRFYDTWVRVDDGWKIVASQATKL